MYLLTVYTPEDMVAMTCIYPTKEDAVKRKDEIESNLAEGWIVAISDWRAQ